jgi:hypothetical protein
MYSIPKQTLWEILSGPERLDIRIPRIQRDYAHGRDEKAAIEVRTTLVTELIDALRNETPQNDSKQVDLGLVFGTADKDEMTLYDGQQRFTTLFLLHWCLAWMARDTSVAEELQGFSYNSRLHSRDFCRALTSEGLKLEPNNTKPSLRFLDATWFCPIWRTDPTVAGMLVVLDLMYDRLPKGQQEAAELWGRLKSGQAPCFSWLKLKMEHRNEDLYVKLNSRGRNLTDYEKLKAWLEKQVKDHGLCKNVTLPLDWERKLDNEWLDLFWRQSNSSTEIMDIAILAFFLGNASNLANATEEGLDAKLIQTIHDKGFLSKEEWAKIFTAQTLPQLLNVLDYLAMPEVRSQIDQWGEKNKVLLFSSQDKDTLLSKAWIAGWMKADFRHRLLYFGLLRFLTEHPPGSPGWVEPIFSRWMRLVRNLGENSSIASHSLQNAIKSIQSIAPNQLQALDQWVSAQPQEKALTGLDHHQWKDEIEKAKLRLAQNCKDTASSLDATENQPFLRGQIGFLIAFATSEGAFDPKLFKSYAATMEQQFPEKDGPKDRVLLQQALLSIGDYEEGDGRKCLGSDRDDWRNIFRSEKKKYLCDQQALQSILKTFLDLGEKIDLYGMVQGKLNNLDWSDWRKWMLGSKHPLEFCRLSCFDVEASGGAVVLIKGRDYRSTAVELRSYYLFKEELQAPEWAYEWWAGISRIYRANNHIRLELLYVASQGFVLRVLSKNDTPPPDFDSPTESFRLRDDEITKGWINCFLHYFGIPCDPETVAKRSQDAWEVLDKWSEEFREIS